MEYEISYVLSAAKALRKLDKPARKRILDQIGKLASNPRPAGAIKLKGGQGEMRIRVGNYRIIYEVKDNELVVLVLALGHRREIYRS